jgi:hypothetical protein
MVIRWNSSDFGKNYVALRGVRFFVAENLKLRIDSYSD